MSQIKYFILALFILLSDQLSKWYVMEHIMVPVVGTRDKIGLLDWYTQSIDRLPYGEIAVLPFFNWVSVWNHGISFGLFNESTDYGPLILIILALVIIFWFVIWLARSHNPLQSTAIAFVIGGALGNVIDRVRFDAVFDFLDFHAFGYHWPAFNIGDSTIVIGVFILIVYVSVFDKQRD